tara:strand:- start:1718 stop:2410 length:693 start_codon:yes stop_codon:yes gene_type:complete
MTDAISSLPILRRDAHFTIAGYQRFRKVIDEDGALPAHLKALLAAVAASARRFPELAARELARGADQGLKVDDAKAGVIVLSSLRGEGAASEFAGLLDRTFGPVEDRGEPQAVSVAEGEARANFESYFGTVPPALEVMLRTIPIAADGYYLMRRGSIDANPLSPKAGELLLLVVLAADHSPMAQRHVEGARRAGASDAEIAETIICAIPSGGIAAWMAAAPYLAPARDDA